MRKHILLSSAVLATVTLIAGGCTAGDPDNPMDIDQSFTEPSDPVTPAENPLKDNFLNDFTVQDSRYMIEYETVNHNPTRITVTNGAADVREKLYNISYTDGEASLIEFTEDEWPGTLEVSHIKKSGRMENIVFDENGHITSLTYSLTTEQTAADPADGAAQTTKKDVSYDVTFTYDEQGHLTGIAAGDEVFGQEWNAEGDLVKINSPKYGVSTLQYTEIANVFAQWEPTLPFMGVFQVFGWFGKAPAHFPKSITMESGIFGDITSKASTLDYHIDSKGLIDQVRWQPSSATNILVNLYYFRP